MRSTCSSLQTSLIAKPSQSRPTSVAVREVRPAPRSTQALHRIVGQSRVSANFRHRRHHGPAIARRTNGSPFDINPKLPPDPPAGHSSPRGTFTDLIRAGRARRSQSTRLQTAALAWARPPARRPASHCANRPAKLPRAAPGTREDKASTSAAPETARRPPALTGMITDARDAGPGRTTRSPRPAHMPVNEMMFMAPVGHGTRAPGRRGWKRHPTIARLPAFDAFPPDVAATVLLKTGFPTSPPTTFTPAGARVLPYWSKHPPRFSEFTFEVCRRQLRVAAPGPRS